MTPSPPPRRIFLTGFPTFAARYLLERILTQEPEAQVWCLVRKGRQEQAQAWLAGREGATRVRLLEGDIRALDFGLTGKEYLEVTAEITDVYHLDGVWHTSASRERLWEVNVQGTQNMLDCLSDLKHLRRYNHLSTAYVCGDRSGVIMEEELEEEQRFLNPYERSQHEAERRVRLRRRSLPVSIYRPSLIVGHSQTGQIDALDGPYLLLQALLNLPVDVPIPLPGDGRVPLNLVPVDWVVDALHTLSLRPEAEGRTFHLVDPNPLSARMVFELMAMAANKPLPRGRLPVGLTRLLLKMPGLEQALRPGRTLLEDFNRWCVFNAMNTADLLADGPRCPAFPDYVEAMIGAQTPPAP